MACVANSPLASLQSAATQSLQSKNPDLFGRALQYANFTCCLAVVQSTEQGELRTAVHARLSPGWILNQAECTEMHPRESELGFGKMPKRIGIFGAGGIW